MHEQSNIAKNNKETKLHSCTQTKAMFKNTKTKTNKMIAINQANADEIYIIATAQYRTWQHTTTELYTKRGLSDTIKKVSIDKKNYCKQLPILE